MKKTPSIAAMKSELLTYHGGPHRFPPTERNPLGEFDPTKIGTGEGAQAYGYGHYLAEAKDVAKSYQPRSPKYEENLLKKYNAAQAAGRYPEMDILEDALLHKSPEEIIAKYSGHESGYTPEYAKIAQDFAKWHKKNPPEVGGLYHVRIPHEHIDRMLDWDKPLSQQHPDVQKALQDAWLAHPDTDSKLTGAQIYRRTGITLKGKEGTEASADLLKQAGIPGIKYLDKDSRAKGEGTRNFVVFPGNEHIMKIVHREAKGGLIHDGNSVRVIPHGSKEKVSGGDVSLDRMRHELVMKKAEGGSAKPFYSALDKAIQGIKQPKGTGEQYKGMLLNAGVKPQELEDRGLHKLSGKMTHQQLMEMAKQKPVPNIHVKVLRGPVPEGEEYRTEYNPDTQMHEVLDQYSMPVESHEDDRDAAERAEELNQGEAKYGDQDLTLPGGKNYREMLFKLPVVKGKPKFESNHYGDKNILAHARVSDRVGPNGEKMLHVEEIQSDWHQKGRKEGYAQPETKRLKGIVRPDEDLKGYKVVWDDGTFSGGYSREGALARAAEGKSNAKAGVPDAPFKKDWHELVMKHLLDHAVRNGYDKVVVTPGEEQAKRYDLSKHITNLKYNKKNDKTYVLNAIDINGRMRDLGQSVPEENLESIVGKDIAKKIIGGTGEQDAKYPAFKNLSGIDLKIGGEGMKGFYDKMLPAFVNKYGAKHGMKMGLHSVEIPTEKHHVYAGNDGRGFNVVKQSSPTIISKHDTQEEANAEAERLSKAKLHSIDLTPQFKQHVLTHGQPMYKEGGMAHMADGGEVEDYRGSHQAPSPDYGAPMHDVTRDMYPKDFYGPNGFRYYADSGEHKDRDAYNKVMRVKGKPDEMVFIHRAIPTKVYKEALKKDVPLKHMIRKGDWVAINKDYAKQHGESVLNGDYKIASMRVPASHVWTNADSIHEWGYHPNKEKSIGGNISMADGGKVEGPKQIGTDVVGRPIYDWRNAVVSHFTDKKSAENIKKRGYKISGEGYYGPAISFSNDPKYASQFGEIETKARIHPNANILNLNDPKHWNIWQTITKNSHPVAYRPQDKTWRQALKEAGYHGVYDAGAGDLFIMDPSKVKHIDMQGMADGGNVKGSVMNKTIAQMKAEMSLRNPVELNNIGVNEALDMIPKVYLPPSKEGTRIPAPGGVATQSGMPIGGIDVDRMAPGQQFAQMPQQQPQMAPQGQPQGQPGQPAGGLSGQPTSQLDQPSNILQMTPQGRAMSAMSPQPMAKGGAAKSVNEMKAELASEKEEPTRIKIKAEGPGGVKGIMVPRHMWHGSSGVYEEGDRKGQPFFNPGMKHINKARAAVYGAENRDPLSIGQVGKIHKEELEHHFSLPLDKQKEREEMALNKLRAAGHLKKDADTLDESEKLDTVRHEHDEQGRSHVGFAAKGVAGHALYTSGYGKNAKYHVINTCPGQTEGCGGGKDAKGIVDTSKGTCFAPKAEQQYVNASVRRACHEQAKHDPAMTRDWILAHTGSLRDAAEKADKNNERLLFRPNVVDETDTSSRHVLRHLNEQRKKDNKPPIIANSYGKTNELHDPENGYYVTHSNVGPKVKQGREITENIGRDKARVRNTIAAADNRGDFKNEQGHNTPPKGSYLVTNVKRESPMSKKMQEHITHAKYWTTGRETNELSSQEKEEGLEGHYGPNGKSTTPEKAHYGHTTINGRRYDYQKQHILHPRLVQVGTKEDGTPNMIPTDSRFKDTDFLPKNRFKTKNGKDAGHILMTTPTKSTSTLEHHTPFTHDVNQNHIEHAIKNRGEYEIDKPEDQEMARGKEYIAPQSIKMIKKAMGGSIYNIRHAGYSNDDFHAFPERNHIAQRHLAMRHGEDEEVHHRPTHKKSVSVHKNLDTMRFELTRNQ